MSLFDKASLMLTPSGVKTDKVHSQKPSNGNGDFTFDRSSTATRVNKDGYIETVAADVPRLNYPLIDGVVQDCPSLILEPARTQLIRYSGDFSNAAWVKSGVTFSNNTITANAGSSFKNILQNETNDGAQTAFFDVEYIDHQWLHILVGSNASDTGFINFDIQNKVVGYSEGGFTGNVIDYGSFIRILVNFNTTDKTSILLSFIDSNAATRVPSSTSTGSFKLYRSQLEQGSYPTSYIPTQGSTVTRTIDLASKTGLSSNLLSGKTQATIFLEFDYPLATTSVDVFAITRSDSTNGRAYIWGSQIGFASNWNGTVQAISLTTTNKVIWRFNSLSNGSTFVAGVKGGGFTGTAYTNIDSFIFGGYGILKVKKLQIFDTALSDTECISLTQA